MTYETNVYVVRIDTAVGTYGQNAMREVWTIPGLLGAGAERPTELLRASPEGNLLEVIFKDEAGRVHRDDGPADIRYYENGNVHIERWHRFDELHRDLDEPAEIFFSEEGEIREQRYFEHGKLHRNDGPARIIYKEDGIVEEWYKKGERLRPPQQAPDREP